MALCITGSRGSPARAPERPTPGGRTLIILGLGTAVPDVTFEQADAAALVIRLRGLDGQDARRPGCSSSRWN